MYHQTFNKITAWSICVHRSNMISLSRNISVNYANSNITLPNIRKYIFPPFRSLHTLTSHINQNHRSLRKYLSSMSVITTAIRRQSSNNNLDYCPQGITAIEMWGHETDPFGNIDVDVPFHTLIRPLNPIKYPEMNRVFVRLLVPVSEEESNKTSFNSNLSRWSEIYELNSTIEGDKVFVKGYIPKDIFGDSLPEMTCLIEIPIKFTVNVEAAGKSNVSIQYMEGNKIIVKSHYGKCLLKEIKAGEVDVYCVKGHIESSGVLQGNIRLKCQNEGIIKANRLQGQTIHCSIGGGIMDIQNIYADTCNLASSALAKLTIGSCHGDTMILMKEGNVNIKNVEGHFDGTIDEGNMEIGLTSTPKNVSVANHKGDIILGLNPSVTAKFELNAKEIKLDEQFSELSEKLEKKIVNEKHSDNPTVHMELQGSIGSNSQKYSQIKATANEGNLILKKHDWMSSLGFTLKTD